MSYATANIIYDPQPVNLSAAVQQMQRVLSLNLSWLQYSFGRAYKAFSKDASGKTYSFPEAFIGGKDYKSMFPNDAWQSYSFFIPTSAAKPLNYQSTSYNRYTQGIDIIFWFNIPKVFPNIGFVSTENMKAQVMRVLREGCEDYTVTGIVDGADDVFRGYDYNFVDTQYLRYPYGGFRVQGTLSWLEQDAYNQCETVFMPIVIPDNAGPSEGDPVWNAEKGNYYTKQQMDALLAAKDDENLDIPGIGETIPAGEAISSGMAVIIEGGEMFKFNPMDATQLGKLVGVAKNAGNIGDAIQVQRDGAVTNVAYSFADNKPVFVTANSYLSTTFDSTVLISQKIGVALNSSALQIQIDLPILRSL